MPASSRTRLRPLRASEILDEAVEMYKSSFWLFAGIAAVLYAPYFVINPAIQERQALLYATDWRGIWPALALAGWSSLIAGPMVTGALTFAVSERYLGRTAGLRQCYRQALRRPVLGRLIVSNAVMFVILTVAVALPLAACMLGLALVVQSTIGATMKIAGWLVGIVGVVGFIFPLYVWGRLLLAVPSVVLESTGSWSAIKRSFALSRGRAAKNAGVMLLVMVVLTVVQSILSAPTGFALARSLLENVRPDPLILILNTLIQGAASSVLMPASWITVILLYYDARIRVEGFDLEVLASEMAAATRGREAGQD